MSKDVYFFDTINAIKTYDSYIGSINSNFYHPYNCYFPLKNPIKNVKRITLKSVEMPLNLFTIRTENGVYKIGLTFSYSTYTNIYINFTVGVGSYTTASLLTNINSALSTALGSTYGSLSIVFTTLTVYSGVVCQITNNCTSLTIDSNTLTNNILGYTNRFNSTGSQALISNSPINVNAIDTCLYLQFPNLPNTNNNNNFCNFKLQLYNVYNGILNFNDSAEHQSLIFNNTPFILDKINVLVTDRLGQPLTGYYNWTFSLIIEYDEIPESKNYFLNFNN